MSEPLFHLAEAEHWERALGTGRYERSTRGQTLDEVGFVHLSTAEQWPRVRERFYAGVDELLLLTVDPGRLGAPVRWEVGDPETGEEFPHLYGPLPVEAVTEVRRLYPGEPTQDGAAGAQRWAAYLSWLREDLVEGVLSLSPQEQRTPRVPSGWTPVELLGHVLHMERRWFVWGFLGEQVDEPWGDWDDADASGPADGARWLVDDDTTAAALAARLRAVGARTEAVLREHPLDARAAVGGRFAEDPPTLEWICFHVLAEYARHAGHLDIVAEQSRG